ncbi:MAG TPA: energy transducer TonB [Myxococcota bacterium]
MQRYLVSASLGAAVTFGLLFVMQALIAMGDMTLDPEERSFRINWVRLVRDTESERIVRVPKQPEAQPPPDLPPIEPVRGPRPGQPIGEIAIGPVGPTEMDPSFRSGFGSDNDEVPIVRVNPTYPTRARMRGVEGWVEVEFTITAAGTVASPKVIGASHEVFARPALRAIRKWRYNPRIVDGRPVPRAGVRVRLVFELDAA